jgi:DnaK suppressor protein
MSTTDFSAMKTKLLARARHLRAELSSQLQHQDDPRVVGMRNRLEETDDCAAADTMALMDIVSVAHDVRELRDVQAALARLEQGTYGECEDCGKTIPFARLDVYPMARRCVACQEIVEAAQRRARVGPL